MKWRCCVNGIAGRLWVVRTRWHFLVWGLLLAGLVHCGVSDGLSQDLASYGTSAGETVLPVQRKLSQAEADAIVLEQGEARKSQEQSDREKAALLRVVERTEVGFGADRLIFNQVAPPDVSAPIVAAEPAGTREPSTAEIEQWSSAAEKVHRVLPVSATVFDRRITHLRWSHEGHDYTAWSALDFNLLRGTVEFETADARYLLLLGVDNSTSEEFEASNAEMREAGIDDYEPKTIPDPAGFTPGEAVYFVETEPGERLDDAAFEGIDALHEFCARNAAQLAIDLGNRETMEAARLRYEAANPEKPGEPVLNFWMVGKPSTPE